MTVGMRTRDINGKIIVDMTVPYSQSIGQIRTNRTNGSLTFPNIPAGKKPFYSTAAEEDSIRSRGKLPGITMTNNSISWAYSFDTSFGEFAMDCTIYYGYF